MNRVELNRKEQIDKNQNKIDKNHQKKKMGCKLKVFVNQFLLYYIITSSLSKFYRYNYWKTGISDDLSFAFSEVVNYLRV